MRAIAIAILFGVCGAASAVPEGWQPVDQAVADLDKLSVSQRVVQVGLRYDGEQTSLFRAPVPPQASGVPYKPGYGPDGEAPYYRVGPGFIARLPRVDYVVRVGREHSAYNIKPRKDGEFIELVTANTFFELRPLEAIAAKVRPEPPKPAAPPVVSGPLDLRLDRSVTPQRVEPQPVR
jgi:hypothetical protein